MALSKKQRQQVREKSGGKCWYCGGELPEKGWHVDHVEPVIRAVRPMRSKGSHPWGYTEEQLDEMQGAFADSGMDKPENDHIGNMVPACAPCNLFKSVFSVQEFRREIEAQVERARKTSVNFRTAERFGLIKAYPAPVVFWFEEQGL